MENVKTYNANITIIRFTEDENKYFVFILTNTDVSYFYND